MSIYMSKVSNGFTHPVYVEELVIFRGGRWESGLISIYLIAIIYL